MRSRGFDTSNNLIGCLLQRFIWLSLLIAYCDSETDIAIEKADFLDTCFQVQKAFCLTTDQVVTPRSNPEHLAAYWSFDSLYAVDSSGNGNHIHPGFRAGPPVFGSGASAYLQPNTRSTAVVVSPKLASNQFTVSFWIYLLDNPTGIERPFLSRGPNFVLSIGSTNRTLILTSGSHKLQSTARLLPQRWTSIAVSYTPGSASLYLNGMLDQTSLIDGSPTGTADIRFGQSSDTSPPSIEAYIDEVKIFNRVLSLVEVSALSIPSLTGISDTRLVMLGCDRCNEDKAKHPTTCPGNYHLCHSEELLQFGFRIARIQGWLAGSTGVWMRDRLPPQDVEKAESKKPEGQQTESDQRLALCCSGAEKCAEVDAKRAAELYQE